MSFFARLLHPANVSSTVGLMNHITRILFYQFFLRVPFFCVYGIFFCFEGRAGEEKTFTLVPRIFFSLLSIIQAWFCELTLLIGLLV